MQAAEAQLHNNHEAATALCLIGRLSVCKPHIWEIPHIINPVAFLLLVLLAAPAFSASGSEDPESQPVYSDDIQNIVVTGQQPDALRQFMEEFVIEIGDPASRGRGFARWRDPLCVALYNLPEQEVAQYIVNEIMIIASEVGVEPGRPGCEPNVKIVFSPDGRELASTMVEETPLMFRPFGNTEGTTQGLAALETFQTSDAPVRWWQITMVVDEVGNPAIQLLEDAYPVVRGEASRLTSGLNDAIWGSLVIVDASKIQNVRWPQLADYLAMVSLAQIDPDGSPGGYDSILNLFSSDSPPAGMTDMDWTYLRALYEMDMLMLPHTQQGVFTNQMIREQQKIQQGE